MQDSPMNGSAAAPPTTYAHQGPPQPAFQRESGGVLSHLSWNLIFVGVLLMAAGLLLQRAKDSTMVFVGRVFFVYGLPMALLYIMLKLS